MDFNIENMGNSLPRATMANIHMVGFGTEFLSYERIPGCEVMRRKRNKRYDSRAPAYLLRKYA